MTAKRAIWIGRAILYPSLALAIGLLLLNRGGDSAVAGPATLYGRTSQGFHFNASFRDGRIFRLHTHVRANCPQARTTYTWTVDDANAYFATDRDTFHLRATATWKNDWNVTVHVRLDGHHNGDRLTGTMSSAVDVYAPFDGTCRSGPVTFSAHE